MRVADAQAAEVREAEERGEAQLGAEARVRRDGVVADDDRDVRVVAEELGGVQERARDASEGKVFEVRDCEAECDDEAFRAGWER